MLLKVQNSKGFTGKVDDRGILKPGALTPIDGMEYAARKDEKGGNSLF